MATRDEVRYTNRDTNRDTDSDWIALGATEPYWGVLTQPEFRTENLTPEIIDAFYASGVEDITRILGRLQLLTGSMPGGPALDFGCGTGRLTEAMAAHVPSVGYDISPGMLAKARAHGGKGTYVNELPAGPFRWINSYIVLQHIPPVRGMLLIEQILDRLAPGGVISLHVTIWRDDVHQAPRETPLQRLARPLIRRLRAARIPTGTVMVYDYDLSSVMRLLNRAGIDEVYLLSTDHGGHHGVIILGKSRRGNADKV